MEVSVNEKKNVEVTVTGSDDLEKDLNTLQNDVAEEKITEDFAFEMEVIFNKKIKDADVTETGCDDLEKDLNVLQDDVAVEKITEESEADKEVPMENQVDSEEDVKNARKSSLTGPENFENVLTVNIKKKSLARDLNALKENAAVKKGTEDFLKETEKEGKIVKQVDHTEIEKIKNARKGSLTEPEQFEHAQIIETRKIYLEKDLNALKEAEAVKNKTEDFLNETEKEGMIIKQVDSEEIKKVKYARKWSLTEPEQFKHAQTTDSRKNSFEKDLDALKEIEAVKKSTDDFLKEAEKEGTIVRQVDSHEIETIRNARKGSITEPEQFERPPVAKTKKVALEKDINTLKETAAVKQKTEDFLKETEKEGAIVKQVDIDEIEKIKIARKGSLTDPEQFEQAQTAEPKNIAVEKDLNVLKETAAVKRKTEDFLKETEKESMIVKQVDINEIEKVKTARKGSLTDPEQFEQAQIAEPKNIALEKDLNVLKETAAVKKKTEDFLKQTEKENTIVKQVDVDEVEKIINERKKTIPNPKEDDKNQSGENKKNDLEKALSTLKEVSAVKKRTEEFLKKKGEKGVIVKQVDSSEIEKVRSARRKTISNSEYEQSQSAEIRKNDLEKDLKVLKAVSAVKKRTAEFLKETDKEGVIVKQVDSNEIEKVRNARRWTITDPKKEQAQIIEARKSDLEKDLKTLKESAAVKKRAQAFLKQTDKKDTVVKQVGSEEIEEIRKVRKTAGSGKNVAKVKEEEKNCGNYFSSERPVNELKNVFEGSNNSESNKKEFVEANDIENIENIEERQNRLISNTESIKMQIISSEFVAMNNDVNIIEKRENLEINAELITSTELENDDKEIIQKVNDSFDAQQNFDDGIDEISNDDVTEYSSNENSSENSDNPTNIDTAFDNVLNDEIDKHITDESNQFEDLYKT